MTEAYIYSCKSHETLGRFSRMMHAEENGTLSDLVRLLPSAHLDNCQVKGSQNKRDRVVVVPLAQLGATGGSR